MITSTTRLQWKITTVWQAFLRVQNTANCQRCPITFIHSKTHCRSGCAGRSSWRSIRCWHILLQQHRLTLIEFGQPAVHARCLESDAVRVRRQEGKENKQVEKVADDSKLNRELLQRWVAWLSDNAKSGTIGSDRTYLNAWREFRRTQQSAANRDESEQTAELTAIAQELQSDAALRFWIARRTAAQFGDDFAFVSANDRATVSVGRFR